MNKLEIACIIIGFIEKKEDNCEIPELLHVEYHPYTEKTE